MLQALQRPLRCKETGSREQIAVIPTRICRRFQRPYYGHGCRTFIGDLPGDGAGLSQFDANLPGLRAYGKNRLVVTPYEAQAEPVQLQRLKAEIGRRWPMTSLLDVLKETDLRVGFCEAFKSLGTREVLDREAAIPSPMALAPIWDSNVWCQAGALSPTAELLYTRHRF